MGSEKKYNEIEMKTVNTIRGLSIDAIEKANSGHPGLPMGAAPMAYTLWYNFLKANPQNPEWFDRDRFVLSAGHGSMLQYSLLHLFGYEVSMDDLKSFRQWDSITPGHPEFGITPGVETTTGPLGQGFANAVGMAVAEKMLAAKFNTAKHAVIDHYTYVLTGDGCLMEGVSYEAASLAGHLKLGKLICLYDANDISLDGPLDLSFGEEVEQRFTSMGWHVEKVLDGDTDLNNIKQALTSAKKDERPSLVIVKTTIGFGSPNKAGKSAAHGAPLGKEEIALTKKALGMDADKEFYVTDEVREHLQKFIDKGEDAQNEWSEMFAEYSEQNPELAEELWDYIAQEAPVNLNDILADVKFEVNKKEATRSSNGKIMNAVAQEIPWLVGGDADLSCSTKTYLNCSGDFTAKTPEGRNIRFGVREHAMGAIANGIAYHGGLRPFTSTFFSFVDYMRPAVRLAALSELSSVFIFTHDSLAVGEDGPTHQPVEQLMSLRCMPDLTVIRPCDASEVKNAWKYIVRNHQQPIALILSRQNILTIDRSKYNCACDLDKGAYILADSKEPQAIIMATGAEVEQALLAYEELKNEGINTRVVSIPSWELFDAQAINYKEKILPAKITKRVSVECGTTFGWERYVGNEGIMIGVDRFGESAPGDTVLKNFGFSVENIKEQVKNLL